MGGSRGFPLNPTQFALFATIEGGPCVYELYWCERPVSALGLTRLTQVPMKIKKHVNHSLVGSIVATIEGGSKVKQLCSSDQDCPIRAVNIGSRMYDEPFM